MGRNIIHDHRVSVAREERFEHQTRRPRTHAELQRAIVDYFRTNVRTREIPDYVLRRLNANNILNAYDLPYPSVHPDVLLVRLIDLNGLATVFHWATTLSGKPSMWRVLLSGFPTHVNDLEIAQWLDATLSGITPSHMEAIVTAVLDIVNTYRRDEPFQPPWVTTWSAFEPHHHHGPNRWHEVLGVPKPPGRWLLLLGYAVREVGTLVRPSQLDAGWYAYHFPSGPIAALPAGGHPMDLRFAPKATVLLPEYIHRQIDHTPTHWKNALGSVGRTTRPTRGQLSTQRQTHHTLLASVYGDRVFTWMPTPM